MAQKLLEEAKASAAATRERRLVDRTCCGSAHPLASRGDEQSRPPCGAETADDDDGAESHPLMGGEVAYCYGGACSAKEVSDKSLGQSERSGGDGADCRR